VIRRLRRSSSSGCAPAGDPPAQAGADAREQLVEGERLGEVVARPRVERRHLDLDAVLGREHQHRHGRVGLDRAGEDAEPVHAGELQVEHQQVPRTGAELGDGLVAAPRNGGRVPLRPEPPADEARDQRLVFDQQNLHDARKHTPGRAART
jgi:hypothetical protein